MTTIPEWLTYLTAIGTIVTPILLLGLGGIGWILRNRIQRVYELEEKLRDDRIQIYNSILEPYVLLLTQQQALDRVREYKGKSKDQIFTERVISVEYMKAAFQLSLIGSDDVVKAFNSLMQHYYKNENTDLSTTVDAKVKERQYRELFRLLGTLFLEIRKSMGNEGSKLEHYEMLEWLIKDIQNYR